MREIDVKCVNTIRILCAEAVQKANSGHPGLPMGAAPATFALFDRVMRHDPANPDWINRDRFVLSAGHGSMLLYSLLHLYGYGLTMDDIKDFRQWGSKAPGHPEVGVTRGVETTTGPLGQGIANAVGMAVAEAHLAALYNREGYEIIDHYTYALVGDGCLEEGISAEASSLAGTWGLGKLIVLYDDNGIQIEGSTSLAFTEDVTLRYRAYGWQVIEVEDGNDVEAVTIALNEAKREKSKPTLIRVKTVIGYGSPRQGMSSAHGEPLGAENVAKSKEFFGFDCEEFHVSQEVREHFEQRAKELKSGRDEWNGHFDSYCEQYGDLYEKLALDLSGKLPTDIFNDDFYKFSDKPMATRTASGELLNRIAQDMNSLMGGAADLGPSTKTILEGKPDFSKDCYEGVNMHFGVREMAMAAIVNGMALHGGIRAYAATFFVFCDYMKHAMRMSALMELPVLYILTHDSIGVGEDGATHQPIEHLAMLRSTPGLNVFRPADARETAAAYESAFTAKRPTALVLSRQNLPHLEGSGRDALRGGYIISEAETENPDLILMGAGSEVQILFEVKDKLLERGVDSRIVSMPCFELFDSQDELYRERVLPRRVRARLAVEAGASFGWHKYVGLDGDVAALDHFGASAPGEVLFEKFGLDADTIARRALDLVKTSL